MKQLGMALIGAGEVAQNFHLPVLTELPSVKLLAIYDINKTKAQFVAERFNIPYVCKTLDEMLDVEAIEAVDICTSTDAHSEIALSCLEAGKNIFIEKPVARTLSETLSIANAAEKYKCKVMVGMNQRFRTRAALLKNYVQHGEIGKVFYVRTGWLHKKREQNWLDEADKSGGGVMLDLGVSLIDLLLWIYEFQPIRSVQAATYQHKTKTVEDVCIAMLRFEDGSFATLETSWSMFTTKNTFYCNVFGSEGWVQMIPLQLYKSSGDIYSPITSSSYYSTVSNLKRSFEKTLKHFVNAALEYTPVISTINEAAYIMKLLEAIYLSAKEGREVIIN